ncbi:MAG: hypothetical protein HC915_17535 [Anaerolineae bacterium]|nr:hypothetical protein [Anaerolineae bacterium]
MLQRSGWLTAPSIFTRNEVPGQRPATLPQGVFKCPQCSSAALAEADDRVACAGCGAQYGIADGIYDFRAPLPA